MTHPLRPEEFIAILDGWSSSGGELPNKISYAYTISTSEEARAVARALASPHIYNAESFTQPLHTLVAFFQSVEAPPAISVIRAEGLPILRAIVTAAVNDSEPQPEDAYDKTSTQLFALRTLLRYGEPGDGALAVTAVRNPRMSDDYMWLSIFNLFAEHPERDAVIDALRDPLPTQFSQIAFLDACNTIANSGEAFRHPFASPAGVAKLSALIDDRDPERYSYAVSTAASIPFLNDDARQTILAKAREHPDTQVRLEAAWAGAKSGDASGRDDLVNFARNPNFSQRAIAYLEELNLAAYIPADALEPDFMAAAEMASWLAHPNEMGRAPDKLDLVDTRELHWPPTSDDRRFWVFRYTYDGEENKRGMALVGSTTFALFGEATADLSPEDVYGLHCAWELEMEDDERAPAQRTAAAGRKILAAANPNFPA